MEEEEEEVGEDEDMNVGTGKEPQLVLTLLILLFPLGSRFTVHRRITTTKCCPTARNTHRKPPNLEHIRVCGALRCETRWVGMGR